MCLLILRRKPWLVLGAFGELGPDSPKMHEDKWECLLKPEGRTVVAWGADSKNTVQAFGKRANFF